MARVVPNAMGERLEFFRTHAPDWVANAADVGLSPSLAGSVQDLTDEAIDAHAAQTAAIEAAKAATLRYQAAMESLTRTGTAAVATIKAFAESSETPDAVYAAARISPPKKPTRRSDKPLSPPSDVRIAVTLNGVVVEWDAAMSDGRFFEVYRQIDDGAPLLLTSVHAKQATDASVPPGTRRIGYQIVAVKGHRRSAPRVSSLQLFGATVPKRSSLRVA